MLLRSRRFVAMVIMISMDKSRAVIVYYASYLSCLVPATRLMLSVSVHLCRLHNRSTVLACHFRTEED